MSEPLHVVLAADPEIPVPPVHYGGIERIVADLARYLTAAGHEVTLVAGAGSTAPGRLETWPAPTSTERLDLLRNFAWIARSLPSWVRAHRAPTVVHSFARLAYWSAALTLGMPLVQSYQREVTPRSIRFARRLARGPLVFTACSGSTAKPVAALGTWRVVHNCVDFARFQGTRTVPSDAPFAFLGRLDRIKGAHTAIDVALAAGRRLVIAGNLPKDGVEREYAEREVIARCDGDRIRYVGPVDDVAKVEMLGRAACLLFPIEWEEPFGIVMTEAMACGTPVVGFRRGSVPEVVTDGVTGYVVDDAAAMGRMALAAAGLDRTACRNAAAARFDSAVIGRSYVDTYAEVLRMRRAAR